MSNYAPMKCLHWSVWDCVGGENNAELNKDKQVECFVKAPALLFGKYLCMMPCKLRVPKFLSSACLIIKGHRTLSEPYFGIC
jgi:hypothetical protein